MTDFDRNSSNNNGREQTKHDPLLELTRLFSGKQADVAFEDDYDHTGYQVADYADSENTSAEMASAGNRYQSMDYTGEEKTYYPQSLAGGDYQVAVSELLGDDNKAGSGQNHAAETAPYDSAYPYADAPDGVSGQEAAYAGYQGQDEAAEWSSLWPEDIAQTDAGIDESRQEPVAVNESVHIRQAFYPGEGREEAVGPLPDRGLQQEWLEQEENWPQQHREDVFSPYHDRFQEMAEGASGEDGFFSAVPEEAGKNISAAGDFDDIFSHQETTPAYRFKELEAEEVTIGQDMTSAFNSHAATEADFSRHPDAEDRFYDVQEKGPENNGKALLQAADAYPQGYGQTIQSYNYTVQNSMPMHATSVASAYPSGQGAFAADQGCNQTESGFSRQEGLSLQNKHPTVNEPTGEEAFDQGFAETLHDFDLTIPAGRSNPEIPVQAMHMPEVNTVGVEENKVEHTETFHLPKVDFGNTSAVQEDIVRVSLEQEFSDIFEKPQQSAAMPAEEDDFQAVQNAFFSKSDFGVQDPDVHLLQQAQPVPDFLREEEEKASGAYDWCASAALAAAEPYCAEKVQERSGRKWVYRFGVLGALLVLSAGAYTYFIPGKDLGDAVPPVIHANREPDRVMPEAAAENTSATPAEAVYSRVEGNVPANAEQKELIDETEMPMDMQSTDEASLSETKGQTSSPVTDEKPPQSTESGLDQTSIENMVMTAAGKSLPVHLVPIVSIQKGQPVKSLPATDEKATVLVPGQAVQQEQSKSAAVDSRAGQAAVPAARTEEDVAAPAAVMEKQQQREAAADIIADKSVASVTADNTVVDAPAQKIVPPAVIPDKPAAPMENTSVAALDRRSQPGNEENAAAAAGNFYVQISSQPSREAAQQSMDEAKRRFGSIIGRSHIIIVPAVIPERGTYYRVRIPAGGRAEALNLCDQYKQAGGSCFIGR